MKEDTWTQLEKMFEEAPMMMAGPVPYSEIDGIVIKCGYQIPSDYREFVHRYGGATVGPYSIYGLRASETMGEEEASAFDLTERFRSEGWTGTENWLVFSADLSGNPIGLDALGEIWISDHENGGVKKIALSFEEYLRNFCLK